MRRLYIEAEKFSKYGVVGLINNSTLYLLFLGLVFIGTDPVITAGICYVLGVAISYVLNRSWAFASTNSHMQDLPRFLAAYGVGLASTLMTIAILLKWLPPSIAQILNIAITAVVIFVMLRIFKFGNVEHDNAH